MEEIHLPVLPLRETVVFPGTAIPLSAGRPGTLTAIDAALAADRRLLAVAQRENRDEVEAGNLYAVGTVVRIAQVQRALGGVQLLIHGEQRARVVKLVAGAGGALIATARLLEDWLPPNPRNPAFLTLYHELRGRSEELGVRRGIPSEALAQLMTGVTEPEAFTDLMSFYVDVGTETKQRLLELLSVEERIRALLAVVNAQLAAEESPAPLPGASIFISYRRGADAGYVTGRIYDRLVDEFGRDAVFKDVESIPLGVDFREHLEDAVSRCGVLIAVISANWHERLHNPRDFVRIELEAALRRSIPVIPVLVQNASIPAEENLPASLQELVYRNGISIRPDPDFSSDMSRLIRGMRALLAGGGG